MSTEKQVKAADKIVRDGDGNQYNIVKIGNQEWLDANLGTKTFLNGDPIPEAKSIQDWQDAAKLRRPIFASPDTPVEDGTKYGLFYNWYALTDTRGLIPEGFQAPSLDDFTELFASLGGQSQVFELFSNFSKLKWWRPIFGGFSVETELDNKYGFNALPLGFIKPSQGWDGVMNKNTSSGFWCRVEEDSDHAYAVAYGFGRNGDESSFVPFMGSLGKMAGEHTNKIIGHPKGLGYNVRCLKGKNGIDFKTKQIKTIDVKKQLSLKDYPYSLSPEQWVILQEALKIFGDNEESEGSLHQIDTACNINDIRTVLTSFELGGRNDNYAQDMVLLGFYGSRKQDQKKASLEILIAKDRQSVLVKSSDLDKTISFPVDIQHSSSYFMHLYLDPLSKKIAIDFNCSHQTLNSEKGVLKSVDFEIQEIYIGGTKSNQSEDQGDFPNISFEGLSFWSQPLKPDVVKEISRWTSYEKPSTGNGLNVDAKNDRYLKAWLYPRTRQLKFFKEPLELLGVWVSDLTESNKTLINLTDKGLKPVDHCLYHNQFYISIFKGKDKKIHLITPFGQDFVFRNEDNDGFQFYYALEKCSVKFQNTSLDDEYEETYLEIKFEDDDTQSINGKYIQPSRPEENKKTTWSDIFANTPSPMESLCYGRDIKTIVPSNLATNTINDKGRIFRMPPKNSYWYDKVGHYSIPFGWRYIPNSASSGKGSIHLISNSHDKEVAMSRGNMWANAEESSESESHTIKVGLGKFGGASVGWSQSYTHGYSSSRNEDTNSRMKNGRGIENMSALEQEVYQIHDYILDKPNILLDGEPAGKELDGTDFQFQGKFYADVLGLIGAQPAKYLSFIQKYGTHYLHAVRFGAIVNTTHEYKQTLTNILAESGTSISGEETYSDSQEFKMESKSNVKIGPAVDGSGSSSLTSERTSGSSATDDEINAINTQLKDETTTEEIVGALSKGSVDRDAPAHIRSCLMPIADLLSPPFFMNNEQVLTKVRAKLIEVTYAYMNDSKAELLADIENEHTRLILLEFRPPNKLHKKFTLKSGQQEKSPIGTEPPFDFTFDMSVKITVNDQGETISFDKVFKGRVDSEYTLQYDSDLPFYAEVLPCTHFKNLHIELKGSVAGIDLEVKDEEAFPIHHNAAAKTWGIDYDGAKVDEFLKQDTARIYTINSNRQMLTASSFRFNGFNVPLSPLKVALKPVTQIDLITHYGKHVANTDNHLKAIYSLVHKLENTIAATNDIMSKWDKYHQLLATIKSTGKAIDDKHWPPELTQMVLDSYLEPWTQNSDQRPADEVQADIDEALAGFGYRKLDSGEIVYDDLFFPIEDQGPVLRWAIINLLKSASVMNVFDLFPDDHHLGRGAGIDFKELCRYATDEYSDIIQSKNLEVIHRWYSVESAFFPDKGPQLKDYDAYNAYYQAHGMNGPYGVLPWISSVWVVGRWGSYEKQNFNFNFYDNFMNALKDAEKRIPKDFKSRVNDFNIALVEYKNSVEKISDLVNKFLNISEESFKVLIDKAKAELI